MKFTTLAITFAMLTLPMMAQAKQKPKVTRIQAEHAALAQIKGGKVLGAKYELESGKYVWSLDVKWGKQIKEVWINPVNGKVMKVTTESAKKEKQEQTAGMTGKKSMK